MMMLMFRVLLVLIILLQVEDEHLYPASVDDHESVTIKSCFRVLSSKNVR